MPDTKAHTQATQASRRKRGMGFKSVSNLLQREFRQVGESRGFAISRLLTHWADIMGNDIAKICTPVKINYASKSIGGTLVLLTKGAQAQMLEMQIPMMRKKVNACYGYNAISNIRITQTAPTGFAEGQALFTPAPSKTPAKADANLQSKSKTLTQDIKDDELRRILTSFGQNIMTHEKRVENEQ